ncbi:MAG: hydrogenase expression/formation protein HypE [Oscillospiraceae bacterium]|nr:hydrogenase expression/formation protein HypE [Oscillospiraceae bacterium]
MDEIITLDYGSGGKKTSRLIERYILPAMDDPALDELGDGAILPGGERLVFSTDSFVVSPRFFPGGDIGKLSVCGTVNDIAMCGGEPRYLSCAFVIEEGLPMEELRQIVASMAGAAREAGVRIVTGDTKVVEKGRGDGIYINTAGIGVLRHPGLTPRAIRPGDAVLVSGTVGDHGTAVMLARSGMAQGEIRSDCAALNGLAEALLSAVPETRCLRDPTRGGVATTLNEFIEGTRLSIELDERAVPVRPAVQAACELLGLDPLYCANEGKLLAVVPAERAEEALAALRSRPEGAQAARIGAVSTDWPGKLVIRTPLGGRRVLQKLSGAQLPRIC